MNELEKLKEENERLRMGLMFYATGSHERGPDMTDPLSGYCFDHGELAQSIIGELDHCEESQMKRKAQLYFLEDGTFRKIYKHLDWFMLSIDRYEKRKSRD